MGNIINKAKKGVLAGLAGSMFLIPTLAYGENNLLEIKLDSKKEIPPVYNNPQNNKLKMKYNGFFSLGSHSEENDIAENKGTSWSGGVNVEMANALKAFVTDFKYYGYDLIDSNGGSNSGGDGDLEILIESKEGKWKVAGGLFFTSENSKFDNGGGVRGNYNASGNGFAFGVGRKLSEKSYLKLYGASTLFGKSETKVKIDVPGNSIEVINKEGFTKRKGGLSIYNKIFKNMRTKLNVELTQRKTGDSTNNQFKMSLNLSYKIKDGLNVLFHSETFSGKSAGVKYSGNKIEGGVTLGL